MNLTAYSSSESSDEDCAHNEDFLNLKATNFKSKIAESYSTLAKNSTVIPDRATFESSQRNSFWSGVPEEENWTDEVSIWGITSHDADQNRTSRPCYKRKDEIFDVVGYVSKRSKSSDVSSVRPILPTNASERFLSSTKLSTHHHIAPALSKAARDSLPKQQMISLKFSSQTINRINWSVPNYSHLLASACADGLVRIIDVFSGACVLTFGSHQKSVKDVAWSPCGHLIASCGFDKLLSITDIQTGIQTFSHLHENYLTCTKFHPMDSNLIVTGSLDVILGWDIRTKNPIRKYKFKDRLGQILDICFLSEKEFISSCDFVGRDTADRCIMVWDFQSSAPISNEIFHEKYTCPRLVHHPFKNEFIAQTQGNYIVQFSTLPPYRMNKHKLYNHHKVSGYGIGCDFSPAGGIIASGNSDGQVVFYNYRTTNVMTRIGDPHVGDVALDVAWHPVLPSMLAYSTWDGCVNIWQ